MKVLSLFTVSLATSQTGDRKFINKPSFLNEATPGWWSSKPAADRLGQLECRIDNYFDTHYAGTTKPAHLARVRSLWSSAIRGIATAFERCDESSVDRKRRAYDPCTDWKHDEDGVVDHVWKDTHLAVMHAGWFVREAIFKSSRRPMCQFQGRRLLARLDRLNAYTEWHYCRFIDADMKACEWRYGNRGTNLQAHHDKSPRFHAPSIAAYQKPLF